MAISNTKKTKKQNTPILPPSVHQFLVRRIIDTNALILLFISFLLFLALFTYHPSDPSLNTATTGDITINNILGITGSYLSDIMLQSLGLAAYIFPIVIGVWGFRILSRREIPTPISKRIIMLLLASLCISVSFARIPSPENWLIGSYLGGSTGSIILNSISGLIHNWMGNTSHIFVALVFVFLSFLFTAKSFGLPRQSWVYGLMQAKYMILKAISLLSYSIYKVRCWFDKHNSHNFEAPKSPVKVTMEEMAKKSPIVTKKISSISQGSRIDKEKQPSLLIDENDDWALPSLDMLDEAPKTIHSKTDEKALQRNAELLHTVLQDFGVQGDIVKVNPGPIITLYELEPAPGTKSSRVIGISDDIARSMSTTSVRVAVIPGKNALGVELPNLNREMVFLKELLSSKEYEKTSLKLPLILGKDIGGEPIIADLAKMPHLLVAGTTGSGKSVAVNTMILSLLYQLSPEKCRLIMIDPKMLELSVYDDIPHLLTPVVTEPHKAITALKWAVSEMEDRYRAMSKLGVRNIDGFNTRIKEANAKGEIIMHKVQTGFDPDTGKPIFEEQPISQKELPYIVIIVDEFADLMLVAGKDVENAIQRLAQMARAAGIHLIMATQRPSVDVITGVIKANFPTRISFQVTSKIDSRTILGDGGAEQLLGRGDMLYMEAGGKLKRVHGPFVDDNEVESVVNFLKSQGEPEYINNVTVDQGDSDIKGIAAGGNDGYDVLYDQAVSVILREKKVSTSFIQRHLQIGYNRAARIVEQMEADGVISEANNAGKRQILIEDHTGQFE